jgi:hypothetical protein
MKAKNTNTIADFQVFTQEQIQQAYRNVTGDKNYTFKFTKDTPENCDKIVEILAKDGQVFPVDFDGIYYSYFANMAGVLLLNVVAIPQSRVKNTATLNYIINSNKKK